MESPTDTGSYHLHRKFAGDESCKRMTYWRRRHADEARDQCYRLGREGGVRHWLLADGNARKMPNTGLAHGLNARVFTSVPGLPEYRGRRTSSIVKNNENKQ